MDTSELRRRLQTAGEPEWAFRGEFPDVTKLGIAQANLPTLRRVLEEEIQIQRLDEEWPSYSEAVWAWRALGQFRDAEAVPLLIRLLEDSSDEDDLLLEELPLVLTRIGEPALAPLGRLLQDSGLGLWQRMAAAQALTDLGENPGLREACLVELLDVLGRHEVQDPILNGYIIGSLITLRDDRNLDLIREAFAADSVDYDQAGDLEDVEIALGVRQRRSEARRGRRLRPVVRLPFHVPPATPAGPPKPGRNEPCPCGSGRKFKHCCLGKPVV